MTGLRRSQEDGLFVLVFSEGWWGLATVRRCQAGAPQSYCKVTAVRIIRVAQLGTTKHDAHRGSKETYLGSQLFMSGCGFYSKYVLQRLLGNMNQTPCRLKSSPSLLQRTHHPALLITQWLKKRG